ncbi:MAG: N-acetylmuramoyl-L-alanine amidase, partial [Candidatus Sulfotelmatobacter sp.]
RRYPHNRLADESKQAIAELDAAAEKARSAKKRSPKGIGKSNKVANAAAGLDSGSNPRSASDESAKDDSSSRSSGHLPRVTGIRHWSTPNYTRVAIDVESEIKFQSQRIADPNRIFFDLPNTKLASTLVGKSFDVDDGFLKKIRVSDFTQGHTRVVLEVDDLSDYNAFLLPNPYRLIIDIHGNDTRANTLKDTATTAEAVDGTSGISTGSGIDADASSLESKSLLAQTGKAPVSSMDVSDDSKVTPASSAPAKKQASLPVKKIVEADDDDDEAPEQAAKRERPEVKSKDSSTSSKAIARKPSTKRAVNADAPELNSSSESAAHGRVPSKSPARPLSSSRPGSADDLDIHEAGPTASGDRSLIRALGLKIGKIVIDAGHGGHDTGTIGPEGLEEKDLVLEVGKRLGKLLETRLGAEVVYTRKDDTFIPLETRTAIANKARADLFISIHANSSHDPSARGVETYYLNFTSSPEALEVAARENAVSAKSIYELQDLVKKIALKEKIEESREFASDVQASLHSGLAVKSTGIRDRGVKKAPFIVLIGANMPSILAEVSFVSNPADERRLETGEYRQRIADSLYRGIAKYVNGLSGVKVASKMDKAAGQ